MTTELTVDDRIALGQLVAAYADAVDSRTFDRLRAVFTDDAILDTGRGVRTGIDEIVATMERLRRYESTFHLLGQLRSTGGPDTAAGVAYCEAHHLLADGGRRTDHVMYIRYIDRFVRTPDGWRIQNRRLEVSWVEQRPVATSE